jgi:hypothetical protein
MKRKILIIAVATALGAGSALAAPPPGKGGGGGEEETLGNNLSVPTLFVGTGPALRIPCANTPKAPGWDGIAAWYPCEDDLYWLQKSVATWSATCANGSPNMDVSADWGDNLTGDGRLSAGRPIRVEMRLSSTASETTGVSFPITKLTPDVEDRLATYGTNGATTLPSFAVYEEGAQLTIARCVGDDCSKLESPPIYNGPMGGEVNSTGAVVYGYNWGIKNTGTPANGKYRLTFTPRTAHIVHVADTKASICDYSKCTYVDIVVGSAGGGKPGGGGGKPPGAGGGKPR